LLERLLKHDSATGYFELGHFFSHYFLCLLEQLLKHDSATGYFELGHFFSH